MKAVIFAGGLGTRLSEETQARPKPMVEIGGRPILWHIMKIYGHYGIHDFVICLGHLGHMIKEFFANYHLHTSNVCFDFAKGTTTYLSSDAEPWRVTLVDTGADTMTGGRLKRARPFLDDETFMLTYGDGVADIDLNALLAHHRASGKQVTITAVRPPGRFGVLKLDADGAVTDFREKPDDEMGWINGGFFVLEPKAIDAVEGDHSLWEQAPLRQLTTGGQVTAYRHAGFWQPMDTLRDKRRLEELHASGRAPWEVWKRPARKGA